MKLPVDPRSARPFLLAAVVCAAAALIDAAIKGQSSQPAIPLPESSPTHATQNVVRRCPAHHLYSNKICVPVDNDSADNNSADGGLVKPQ